MYHINVIKSVWRRVRRPSEKTLREIRGGLSRAAYGIEPPRPTPAPCEAPINAALDEAIKMRERRRFAALMTIEPPRRARAVTLTGSELRKFAMQNLALLFVLDSHDAGQSSLSPSALAVVRRALTGVTQI